MRTCARAFADCQRSSELRDKVFAALGGDLTTAQQNRLLIQAFCIVGLVPNVQMMTCLCSGQSRRHSKFRRKTPYRPAKVEAAGHELGPARNLHRRSPEVVLRYFLRLELAADATGPQASKCHHQRAESLACKRGMHGFREPACTQMLLQGWTIPGHRFPSHF